MAARAKKKAEKAEGGKPEGKKPPAADGAKANQHPGNPKTAPAAPAKPESAPKTVATKAVVSAAGGGGGSSKKATEANKVGPPTPGSMLEWRESHASRRGRQVAGERGICAMVELCMSYV